MKKQTAVEWLVNELNQKIDYIPMDKWDMIRDIVLQAKEMEKEQIIESYCQGCADIINNEDIFPRETAEKYYKETYESNTGI